MMKRILFGLGASNTGKSTITKALIKTCSDYVGTFDVLKDGFIDLFFFIGVMAVWAFRGVEVIWPAFVFAKVGKQGVH